MNQLVRASAEGEVLTAHDTVRVIGASHPLRARDIDMRVPAGLSIAEIVALVRSSTGLPHLLLVWIDGDPVPQQWWDLVRPKAGRVVLFRAVLAGSSGLRTALGLAIAVAAIAVAGPLAGALGFVAGTIGFSVTSGLISAAIIVGGTYALNALFPARPAQLESESESFTQLASLQGAQNRANPYGAIPVVLGTHRLSPIYAAKPYTELVGNSQWLRLLFCWGYGPLAIDTASLKIGETPLTSFSDYTVEHRQGLLGDAPITLYPSQYDEQALAIELTSGQGVAVVTDGAVTWFTRTTTPDTDFLSIDVTFPEGVWHVTNTGYLEGWQSYVRAQYRAVGSSGAWTDLVRDIVVVRELQTARRGASAAVARGQYDVRVGKASLSQGAFDAKFKDKAVWTALRSYTNGSPIAFAKPLALTAIRIKASDQLNGVIDTFNGEVTSLVTAYDGVSDWNADTASSNPADLFRHVLQGPANARPVADALIDLDNLQDWWTYCDDEGFTFNQVRDRSSVYETLADIASAGRAVPTFIDGKWGVIWDRADADVVQYFTPRNSWNFSGSRAYPRLPHGWRVGFINQENGYSQDERIVYDDGYSAANATLFEALEFPGVTDPDLIWRHGRFQIAQARLRPERISLSVDWEHLVATRGDRVRVTHDVLLIGLASARVKAVAGQVVTLDEVVIIEADKTYGVQFRHADAGIGIFTRAVDVVATGAGETQELTMSGSLADVAVGQQCAFGETDRESAVYRIYAIAHQQDLVAQLTLVDDAPDIAGADTGAIPAYSPNITIPPDPFTLPPQDLQYQEVIDGVGASVRALVRLSWQMPRLGGVAGFEVQSRDDDGDAVWQTVETVPPPRTSSDVPIIAAGVWSFRVRALFTDGSASAWVSLLNLNLSGLTFAPGDIVNLHQRSVDGQTVLAWDIVIDQRLLRYEVRKGTSWDTALLVGDEVTQPPWPTTGDGTYHVRAYVLSPFVDRIYSEATASITIVDSIISRNIIVSRDEQNLSWPGGLDGGVEDGSFIRTDVAQTIGEVWAQEVIDQLAIDGLHVAVYLSPTVVDIGRDSGRWSECRFWTEYEAVGVLQGEDFLALADVLASADFLGSESTRFIRAFPIWRFAKIGDNDVFGPVDIYATPDIFQGDTEWEDWVAIASGTRVARFFQAGLVLITDKADVDATATKFSWFVDVPDRTDDYTALTVPDTGLALTFYPGGYSTTAPPGVDAVPFNGGPNAAPLPHVQRAIVAATNGDEVKITNLTLAGCTVHVVNAGSNVTRSGVNLLVRGY